MVLMAGAAVWADAPGRPQSSPRTFVMPASCYGRPQCPQSHWAFSPPDCRRGDLVHPPGTVVRFEDQPTMQCRCRLIWLRTKPGEPPEAKVTCRWVDVDEARQGE